jgi:predicted double-glycine peptidase
MTGDLDMNDHIIKEATLDLGDLDNQEYRGFILTTQIAGESLSFGEQVYRASDNRLNKTDADTLSKTEGDLAIVVTTGTTAENGYVTILKLGTVKNTSWSFTIGTILYVSQTAGVITATEPSAVGSFSRKVGFAQAADIIYLDPSHTILENG